jgi:Fe-S-cluster-containing dehydrogenase component/DMSO reductase anchor subunit
MSLSDISAQEQGKRFGMVIDVNRCVGCQTCTISCKHANDTTPGVQWRQVLDVEQGVYPDVERFFLVVGCQHCAKPPCVPVCPTGATFQRDDGLVAMDYDLCIGCAYCAVSCPYQARTIAHDKEYYFGAEETVQERQVAHEERFGVAQKCTFCIDRIDEADDRGLAPGVDLEVTPACAASCITQAIQFGDFNDPESKVSTLVRDRKNFQINDFLETDPQIKYLYDIPNAVPGSDAPALRDDELRDRNNPLAGKLQKFWDYRAAMNFMLGGMGSGFLVVMAAFSLLGLLEADVAPVWAVAGGISISIGLLFVFAEIGRKLRFLYALLRPQSSWMTREIYVVAILFPLLGATWTWPGSTLYLGIGLVAAVFLLCQARIIYAAKGIPSWRAPLLPWLISATGISEGFGGALIASGALPELAELARPEVLAAALVSMLTLAVLFSAYVSTAEKNNIPPLARDVLQSARLGVWAGTVLGVIILVPGFLGFLTSSALIALAGLAMIAAGLFWKFLVITRASYQQGFDLPKIPQKGSGLRSAPPRLGGLDVRPENIL